MSESRSALYELTLARTRDFLRTGEALFWVFLFPILMALALGFAFREKPPERTPVGVVAGQESNRIMQALAASPALLPRVYPDTEGIEALRTGRISLLVRHSQGIAFVFDPSRPDSRIARLEAEIALQSAAGRKDPLSIADEEMREPGARYIDFLLPGLIGMNLMGTGMWAIGFSIVTARQRKLLKRLVATPMRKSDYLLSQMLSRLIFLVAEVVAIVGFGWLVFDVAVRGSIILLGVICLLGAMAFSGLGLLVASRSETVEGVSGLMNFVMLPMWLLSGVFFSADRFPDAFQPFIRALPLTALNDALRAVMNEARPIQDVTIELGILLAWTVGSFFLALRIFRWR
jgi:ABC-2 type transport system permease protein